MLKTSTQEIFFIYNLVKFINFHEQRKQYYFQRSGDNILTNDPPPQLCMIWIILSSTKGEKILTHLKRARLCRSGNFFFSGRPSILTSLVNNASKIVYFPRSVFSILHLAVFQLLFWTLLDAILDHMHCKVYYIDIIFRIFGERILPI